MKSNQNKWKWFTFLIALLITCIGVVILVANHTFFVDKYNDLEPEKKQQEIEKIETCIKNTKISDDCILQIESDLNGITCTATVLFENSGSAKERLKSLIRAPTSA